MGSVWGEECMRWGVCGGGVYEAGSVWGGESVWGEECMR